MPPEHIQQVGQALAQLRGLITRGNYEMVQKDREVAELILAGQSLQESVEESIRGTGM